ncbi:ATP-binding protein [Puia dinghuensis]|uniref:histidine kinase n=1 Tax=Puia dinghuensis TaxID=1792502 RepID=A0A8J2UD63_9BACT|nr:ATP-binding protein [Puia dinghuensis]GGB01318.1 hypothetical protein GCM10011511_25790 [Puia dinghuensis]
MTSNRFIYIILAAFIAGVLLLIYIQYNSSRSIDQLIDGNRLLLNDMKLGNDLREMERDLLSEESKIRAAVATGDPSFLQGADEQIADARANLDTLRRMNPDTGSDKDIDRLSVLARERQGREKLVDSFFHVGKTPPSSIIANTRTREAANEINTIMRRLYARRKDRLAAVSASVQKYGRIARTSGIILISLMLLSAGALFWFIIDRIRKQNQLISELDTSERKLQEAVRIKENFLANMSHEIRTPLNSIIGYTGLLARQPLNEPSREFVIAISQSGANLLAIVNDILDLSKIEAGMMRVETSPFSIRQLLHSVDTLFRHRIVEKGLSLEVIIDDNVPDNLLGDATRLTQILVNLIGNALKFTENGGITLHAATRPARQGYIQLWVTVSDTGIGIAKDQLSRIFQRFSQAESSITRKYGGTGLGLAIVKELIDLQKGSVEVESAPGKGTTFRFYIPYETVQTAPARLTAPQPGVPAALHGANVRILIADDNKMNQRLMEHLLAGQGLGYDVVDDGRQVIEFLGQTTYDLVLMDIQMPVMDGYTATRIIRQELRLTVPIVAMTAHAMPGEREKCLASGMNEYLSKPIVEAELYRVLGQLLRISPAPVTPSHPTAPATGYRFIDTTYLRELSGGDKAYEREMAGQFLETIPTHLQEMGSALAAGDRATVSQIAHNMKTTVSIMGMAERLFVLLDMLEYPEGFNDLSLVFGALKQVCGLAIEETRRFAAGN